MNEVNGQQGLYTPQLEHDACGIGFVASLKGQASHQIIQDALTMLQNMEHRGGCGCEPETGDGAGILIQNPHTFFKQISSEIGIQLPDFGKYGVGMVFFPKEEHPKATCKAMIAELANQLGLYIIGYRTVPVNPKGIGASALSQEPAIEQVFIAPEKEMTPDTLERKLFILRNYSRHTIQEQEFLPNPDLFYWVSLSHKILVYKGQLRTDQLPQYYLDLQDERLSSALAQVHSRFSTNTFPKWKLAQPFRYLAHNGEINTIRGNTNWMKSKEALLASAHFTQEELNLILPICNTSHSDSANLDAVVEMMVLGGRSIAEVMMILIPEAWQENKLMDDEKKAYYEYHSSLMEPWDGPASVCFTDGKVIGATLDRNGLRPSRYVLTEDDILIMSSEAGALPIDESKAIEKGRLQPGKIFVVDLEQGRIIRDEELKHSICSAKPYQTWLKENKISLDILPSYNGQQVKLNEETILTRQLAFGYTYEDLKMILAPMVQTAHEPISSMGMDIPLAALSDKSQHLSHYFKQLFAQVSNPPIDPIREKIIMSLFGNLGATLNLLDATPEHCRQIHLDQPVLTYQEVNKLKNIRYPHFKSKVLSTVFPADNQAGSLEKAVDRICLEAEQAVLEGCNILILSDKEIDENHAPIPSLMITGAVHHHLIQNKLRAHTSLVVESGDVRETHHFATLIGYGANAIHPYLAFESILYIQKMGLISENMTQDEMFAHYIKAIAYGLRKIFSKMGISTLQSYQGAQIFEVLGLGKGVVDKCFKDSISRIGGLNFDDVAREVLMNFHLAYPKGQTSNRMLDVGGVYQWKKDGEFHLFNPTTIHYLQKAVRNGDFATYQKYAESINLQVQQACTLRGLLDFKDQSPIPLEEVEPIENIFKRFATGAMSFGSISHEAHVTLAIAMNRIGAKSNSGEGGEDEIRFERKENGDWERSAIKQVASGRFGVTSYYLANANELQIKMAQGAKPGEGGQLPGHKVDAWIGRVRHSTPGVGLISPPPHHDIYSIEDLAQLIFDLKNANRDARINVKLVSEAGVGTIAAGVAKAKADVVLIAGHDGGTGASPISSIRHAGLPWELGLAETHQTLVKNKLRNRIVVQTDGQLRTGRDLAIATLLGAEEWGIATAALVAEGCIMMRKCHLNTCPVGIATQNPELRKKFTGKPEHIVHFFTFLAQDLRIIMAELGFRTINEMVGQVHKLKVRDQIDHWKLQHIDLSPILYQEKEGTSAGLYQQVQQDHGLAEVLDWKLIELAKPALEYGEFVYGKFDIINTDRAVGTMLSHEISKKYKNKGLPNGAIHLKFKGSAGQSFAAFGARGIRFELEGEANDYFGKGLSGAQLIIYPHQESKLIAHQNMIIGNVAFYGATSGEAYIRGLAGERFCVRNSGLKTLVEGVGDHGCEYMTGGLVVVLGEIGRNFAAGMSGGVAYIYDPKRTAARFINTELVDLDPLEDEDIQLLSQMIREHWKFTQSEVAQCLIEDWDIASNAFIKVMPRDYKAILQTQKINNTVLEKEKVA
ncbi:MAG: glutamate synthase large subunit [Microscillaceae bacterium]|nr:glutamate synthase large subunit [Microscillaceae bacterium]